MPPLSTPSLSLHAQLRTATAPAHQRLEDALDLLRQPPDRERLVRTLVGFHGFHQVWEQALVANALPAGLTPAPRLPLIEQDLRALGLSGPEIGQTASCDAAAALGADPATALGSVYVLEGSTLGGQVIGRHFRAAGWCPAGGLRYFDPYGAATASRWRTTLALLEGAGSGGDHDRIVAGAVQTFEVLRRWLAPAE